MSTRELRVPGTPGIARFTSRHHAGFQRRKLNVAPVPNRAGRSGADAHTPRPRQHRGLAAQFAKRLEHVPACHREPSSDEATAGSTAGVGGPATPAPAEPAARPARQVTPPGIPPVERHPASALCARGPRGSAFTGAPAARTRDPTHGGAREPWRPRQVRALRGDRGRAWAWLHVRRRNPEGSPEARGGTSWKVEPTFPTSVSVTSRPKTFCLLAGQP